MRLNFPYTGLSYLGGDDKLRMPILKRLEKAALFNFVKVSASPSVRPDRDLPVFLEVSL